MNAYRSLREKFSGGFYINKQNGSDFSQFNLTDDEKDFLYQLVIEEIERVDGVPDKYTKGLLEGFYTGNIQRNKMLQGMSAIGIGGAGVGVGTGSAVGSDHTSRFGDRNRESSFSFDSSSIPDISAW